MRLYQVNVVYVVKLLLAEYFRCIQSWEFAKSRIVAILRWEPVEDGPILGS